MFITKLAKLDLKNNKIFVNKDLTDLSIILFTEYKIKKTSQQTSNYVLLNKLISIFNKKGKKKKYTNMFNNQNKYFNDDFNNLKFNLNIFHEYDIIHNIKNKIDITLLTKNILLKNYFYSKNILDYFLTNFAPIFKIKVLQRKKTFIKKIIYTLPQKRYLFALKMLYFYISTRNIYTLTQKIQFFLYNHLIKGSNSTLIKYKIKLYKKALQSNLYD